MKIIDFIAAQAANIATPPRDLHAHPERCCTEVRTADVWREC
jgi:hippurate hydrolase